MRLFGKMILALAGVATLLVVVIVIGAYTFLPGLVEGLVARNLEDNLGLSSTPEVSISSDPAYELLTGDFDSGEVVLQEPEFAGVRPERVRMNLDGFEINVVQSVREGGIRVDGPLSGNIRVVLSEGELERIASTGIESVPVRGIGISGDSLTVDSTAQFLGISVPISVRGSVDVEGGEIVFSPERVSAFGTTLSESLTDQILSGTHFGYPVEDLPFNGEITGIETGDGTLALEGSVQDLPIS